MLHRKTIELAEKKYRGNFKNWPRQNRKINNRICCEKSKVLKLSELDRLCRVVYPYKFLYHDIIHHFQINY